MKLGKESTPLLTEAQRHRILVEWNDTQAEYPKNLCIHELFEAQAAQTPDAIAVVFKNLKLTYRELNCRANQLAFTIREFGVKPEALVGLYVERSLEMIIGVLGILKAGGAYVPLDPAYPKDRLAFMLESIQSPILLTQKHLLNNLPVYKGRVVCLDSDRISAERSDNPAVCMTVENLAYVIFTSGSAGKPKGILLHHRGLCNLIHASNQLFNVNTNSRIVQFASFSFDVATWEIFMALIAGATLTLLEHNIRFSILKLPQMLRDRKITMALLPPSLLAILPADNLPDLHTIIAVGERCSTKVVKKWGPGRRFFNGYGPAEATVTVSVYLTSSKEKYSLQGPPIGRPISNTQLYILDHTLQPVSIGDVGELHIGGLGLARSYLNRPELTAKNFIPNPFSEEPNSRLYKTGDLARYLPDGNIEFLGRIDNQVKIHGFRIELGEIEAILDQHPHIQKSVILVRENDFGNKYLSAYLVYNQKKPIGIKELRSYLKRKLPNYMIPSTFVRLNTLPVTPNGKIDRRGLAASDQLSIEMNESFVAPNNEMEIWLVQIWEKMLGIPHIGITDGFFDLGGDSLSAIHLLTQIEKRTGKKLPLATLFHASTIQQLATILLDEKWAPSWSSLVPIQPNGSKPPFFCMHGAGGNVLLYHALARHLGNDQPFYGLQSQGLDGKQPFYNRIEDMASHYIKEIQMLQTEGPYFLGGYCMGGTIAYEMARQFQAQGKQVALLAMFDTYNWSKLADSSFLDRFYYLIQQIEYHFLNFFFLDLKEKPTFVLEKVRVAKRRIKARSKVRKSVSSFGSLRKTNDLAAANYVPRVYHGRVIHIESMKQYMRYKDPKLGWDSLAPELNVEKIPVYPGGMLIDPFAQILAERLKINLNTAQID